MYRELADAGQRSDEWRQARTLLVTASDVPAILGLNKYKSQLELYLEKVGQRAEEPQSEAAKWGLIMEPVLIEEYKNDTEREAWSYQKLCMSEKNPWLGATCDALVKVDENTIPLELKTASEYLLGDWSEGCPPNYMPQIQTQMMVMGATRCSIAVLIGGNKFRWCDEDADPKMQALILEQTHEFYMRVKNEEPPDPDASDSAKRALQALYPKEEPGKVVQLGMDAVELDDVIRKASSDIKAASFDKTEAQNKLMALIGDAETGALPGGGSWKWSSTKRKAKESRVLRRYK